MLFSAEPVARVARTQYTWKFCVIINFLGFLDLPQRGREVDGGTGSGRGINVFQKGGCVELIKCGKCTS